MEDDKKADSESFIKEYFSQNNIFLPSIRISKIEINGFKSVEHGEIVLECGRQHIPAGLQSDILGIYGQNGSGKTSLIEALSILSMAMSGSSIFFVYTDCISVKSEKSTLSFTFDLQYNDGEIRIVEYTFSLKKVELTKEEIKEQWQKIYNESNKNFDESFYESERTKYKLCIFDEKIKVARIVNGKKGRLQTIIDTSSNCLPFGPTKRSSELIGKNKNTLIDLSLSRELSLKESKSFVFCKKTLQLFDKKDKNRFYSDTLYALCYYATYRLYVVDSRDAGFIGLNISLPIHSLGGFFMGKMWEGRISVKKYNEANELLTNISTVLSQLIPGLSIELKILSDTVLSNGDQGYLVMPMANRDGKIIPLRDESDGVRKIISVLDLIIAAYNNESITIAIDEFDAGIFEYLLGEILQSFEESGKGQFIFTSHNLRPLEVINKKFIAFTTTNENNRYYRFKDVASTNNLRDRYFREILLGEQEESLYNKTKRFKIDSALRKAGMSRHEDK